MAKTVNRRQFVKQAAAASTVFSTFTIAGTKSSGRVLGANDTVRVAVCGINGQGRSHIQEMAGQRNVDVTHLADPDRSLFASRCDLVEKYGRNRPECVQDVRRVLDNPNVDAITCATCNHWHSLIGVWACQAGKDAYIEKPISHNIWEGRKLVEAAARYQRVVQHGTQQRSDQNRANEIAAVQSGKYGKLLVSKGYCCKPRWSIGVQPIQAPPPHLDFDLWLGPARAREYHANLAHYNWHWFWDTGNGDSGNQGVHELDVARWAIKDGTMPDTVWSLGGRFGYDDQGETPNTQLSVYLFGDVTLLFETRGLVGKHKNMPAMIRNEYYTTDGMITDGKFYPTGGDQPQSVSADSPRQVTPGGRFGSFIASVRDRSPDTCNCDAEVGHYSSALCHLGNISYRLGEQVAFDRKSQALGDNKQVVESFENVKANCQAVGMDLSESTYQLGRVLQFDPDAERFIGDDDANAMLGRNYRDPYVIPDVV